MTKLQLIKEGLEKRCSNVGIDLYTLKLNEYSKDVNIRDLSNKVFNKNNERLDNNLELLIQCYAIKTLEGKEDYNLIEEKDVFF